jgi:hypothetical protein
VLRRILHTQVEPDGAVEGHALVHEDVGQFVRKRLAVRGRLEVVGAVTPLANPADDATDQLLDTLFALGRTDVPTEVLRHHYVGGELRPGLRNLDAVLLEDDVALLVTDHRVAQLPFDVVERVLAFAGEIALDGNTQLLLAGTFAITDGLQLLRLDLALLIGAGIPKAGFVRSIDPVVHLFSSKNSDFVSRDTAGSLSSGEASGLRNVIERSIPCRPGGFPASRGLYCSRFQKPRAENERAWPLVRARIDARSSSERQMPNSGLAGARIPGTDRSRTVAQRR